MMVIFLTGLVSMILLRTLRRDYARYTARDTDDLESLERDMSEESGWKLVRPAALLLALCPLWEGASWHRALAGGCMGRPLVGDDAATCLLCMRAAAPRYRINTLRPVPLVAPLLYRQVHGDVFRPPRFLEVLAASIGTGVQLALLVLAVILITIAGE
jgi:hypothetical protein